MNEQEKLEKTVQSIIDKHGVDSAVEIIKQSTTLKTFACRKHYQNGVYVYCNSPEGGLMVGRE